MWEYKTKAANLLPLRYLERVSIVTCVGWISLLGQAAKQRYSPGLRVSGVPASPPSNSMLIAPHSSLVALAPA
jgi:hypothetical protein